MPRRNAVFGICPMRIEHAMERCNSVPWFESRCQLRIRTNCDHDAGQVVTGVDMQISCDHMQPVFGIGCRAVDLDEYLIRFECLGIGDWYSNDVRGDWVGRVDGHGEHAAGKMESC